MLDYLMQFYRPSDCPALLAQHGQWQRTRPFAGLKVLDATPVFRNTMFKYAALLAGGAELTVAAVPPVPSDPAVIELLRRDYRLRVVEAPPVDGEFDVVLDCAGVNCAVPARAGYVELTRSGMYRYRDAARPVFLADDSRIKEIETCLGTGDGFFRAMKQLGYRDFQGRRAVVFGYGKVGRGVVMYLRRAGVRVTVVDDPAVAQPPAGTALVNRFNSAAIDAALAEADYAVSVTGIRHAHVGRFDAARLAASPTVLVNMGVEDEFGPAIPAERVLNGKQPLNFILEEPTQLKFIDPTLALHNRGALEVLSGRLPSGLNRPSPALEEEILAEVERAGVITEEIREMEQL